jgi:2-polyprenyl-3-methyl-5-hydroxy-6-metoxy-1,4-benzoquinol methylase
MPQKHVFDAVLRAARRLPGYPRLRVLDLSAGRGEIAAALAGAGATVRGTHFRADDYKLADAPRPLETGAIPIDADVDLTRPLPYPDGSFDLVVLCEVAEHLPTYIPAVLEIGRVLEAGGHLILSTPNVGRLHSRWHFFWTGTHKLIRRRPGWDLTPDDLYAYHINPVDLPLLHTLLHQAGLAIVRLDVTRFKAKHAWLLLTYPFVWLSSRLETSRHRAGPEHARGENDLFRWLVSFPALVSEQLLLTARRDRPV